MHSAARQNLVRKVLCILVNPEIVLFWDKQTQLVQGQMQHQLLAYQIQVYLPRGYAAGPCGYECIAAVPARDCYDWGNEVAGKLAIILLTRSQGTFEGSRLAGCGL